MIQRSLSTAPLLVRPLSAHSVSGKLQPKYCIWNTIVTAPQSLLTSSFQLAILIRDGKDLYMTSERCPYLSISGQHCSMCGPYDAARATLCQGNTMPVLCPTVEKGSPLFGLEKRARVVQNVNLSWSKSQELHSIHCVLTLQYHLCAWPGRTSSRDLGGTIRSYW